ncbi:WD40/YVTN/BNR-like repeat-containing protein [Pseudomonas knackmussii]|uniref:WD40/YVTN/BNR-like repeat-containing protein n=1 Tax=Pseudomonas knackmussii TaxID=65741 RepID=UPI003BC52F50
MLISLPRPWYGCLSFTAALLTAMATNALGAAPTVAAQANLFEQPALQSALAPHSLMLSVAQAGKRLVAVGERGFILVSDDLGSSWRQVDSPVSVTLTRVRFPTANDGWAVGHAGVILHSGDGGLTWTLQLDGERAAQLALEAARKETGENAQAHLDNAQRLLDDGPDKPFLNLHFSDARHGLVIGAYGLAFATDDGGSHWRPISAYLDNPSALHLYDILEQGGVLFIAGEQGLLLRSTDGGASFQALQSPATGTLFGMVPISERGLVTFGLRGKAYRSDDLGEHWQALPDRLSATLTAGARLNDGSLVLADESGALQLSRDRGEHFESIAMADAGFLSGITELANGQLAISGIHGVILLATQNLNRSTGREQ